ncbi:MAG: hypothetical protein KAY37_16545 [Phycisphaerae bacterium]|nr:hypothetical protein [Phycisphaerae bacterium]
MSFVTSIHIEPPVTLAELNSPGNMPEDQLLASITAFGEELARQLEKHGITFLPPSGPLLLGSLTFEGVYHESWKLVVQRASFPDEAGRQFRVRFYAYNAVPVHGPEGAFTAATFARGWKKAAELLADPLRQAACVVAGAGIVLV